MNPFYSRNSSLPDPIQGTFSSYHIGVLHWNPDDGISTMISEALERLGHRPLPFFPHAEIPRHADLVISHVHGPPRRLLPILERIAKIPVTSRPITAHWNTEGYPDLRLPAWLIWKVGSFRSLLGRAARSRQDRLPRYLRQHGITTENGRLTRFRNVGDYEYAYRKGWLEILGDSSRIYAEMNRRRGIPTVHVPWGTVKSQYAELGLERDIDVLWMGKRASWRRGRLLDRIRRELNAHGIEMYVADNEENPFIFGDTRTRFLNRAKITLNLTRTWYDDNFSRFAYAAPNRSLIISETLLPHCPDYMAGTHYVSAPKEQLTQTILYYLTHEEERRKIVEEAYRLTTTTLAFHNGLARLIEAAVQARKSNLVSQRESERHRTKAHR